MCRASVFCSFEYLACPSKPRIPGKAASSSAQTSFSKVFYLPHHGLVLETHGHITPSDLTRISVNRKRRIQGLRPEVLVGLPGAPRPGRAAAGRRGAFRQAPASGPGTGDHQDAGRERMGKFEGEGHSIKGLAALTRHRRNYHLFTT